MNDAGAAEELPLRWNRTYSDATYNGAASVVEDGDAYVVLGQSGSEASGIPGWLFGTDATGGEGEWTATVASDGRQPPTFQTHLPAVDGDGYALLGVRAQAGSMSLVRTDADGAIQWWETYEGDADGGANASVLARDAIAAGDGYLIAGARAGGQGTDSHGLVVRVGPDGSERSRTRLFTDQQSEIRSVVPDGDGYAGVAVVQSSSGDGASVRSVLFRADADDEIQWREEFTASTDGGPLAQNQLVDLAVDGDGYVAAGYAASSSFDTVDGWVLSVDGSGEGRATRRLSPRPVTLFTGVATTDDGVVVAGQGSESPSSQAAVGLVGELGDGLEANWSKRVSVGAVNNVRDVIATGDGGVALAGITQYRSRTADPRSEAWLVKLGGEDAPRVTATAPDTDAPSSTATASPTPEPTATPSPTPSPTPEPTDDPTATATATVPATAAPDPTETTDGDGSGFGAGAALAALGGTALYERVRDED
ncbi:hypothetical protein HZS55_02010 [Halosimplex rubrum]|uniref:PQQ-binding-like beta-propeller repeat protein n=1 Tax=Halosimplex rubrum TaxID=869889 RepID=A0A7D5T3R1_9EURY|nr:hypothetical protein [Halosimplex rubrum]QLH76153.1 hypothetical protein HZS55_02010 [Halosimplex rubrum]